MDMSGAAVAEGEVFAENQFKVHIYSACNQFLIKPDWYHSCSWK